MSLLTGPLRSARLPAAASPARRSRWSATASTASRWPSPCCHDHRQRDRLAALAVANLVPRVAFGLLGGVLADRFSRRAILRRVRPGAAGRRGHARCCCCSAREPAVLAAAGPASRRSARPPVPRPGVQRDRAGPGRRGRAGRGQRAARQRQPDGADGGRAGARRRAGGVDVGLALLVDAATFGGVGAVRAAAAAARGARPRAGRGRCRGRTSARGCPTSGARRGWR